ncbi:MAG: hypothetical protein CL967_06095 [Euryarchaeota archaeon]|nr:hypothetical protein [Euryarchaeota archaeon]
MGYDDGWDDYNWDDDYDWYQDDDLSSSSGVSVLLVDPPDGIGRHPAIRVGEYLFLTTSQTKRRGESGYVELPQGEGGLERTSFVNLNKKFDYNSCNTICEIGELSLELWNEISTVLERYHPDIDLDNLSLDEDFDDYNDWDW